MAVWLILQKIRRLCLYSKSNEPISYLIELNGIIPFPDDSENYVSEDNQYAILKKLEEWKLITSLVPILGPVPDSTESTFSLIQPVFDEFYEKSKNRIDVPIVNTKKKPEKNLNKMISLKDEKAALEKNAGNLAFFSDGSIRIKNEVIPMRSQLKVLCRMFIGRPGILILVDEIKEELINHDKKAPNETISKYVSELRRILERYSYEGYISNEKKEGWTLVIGGK